MRIFLKWLARCLIASTLIAGIVVGGLMTSPGQRMLILAVQSIASSDGNRVEIGLLEGSLFSRGRIDRIVINDRKGTWLDVRDVKYSWNPFALVTGRIEIARLAIAKVEILRHPNPSQEVDTADDAFNIPMFPLDADQIAVAEIILGKSLLGTQATLRLDGSANLADTTRGLYARVNVTRTDGAGGDLTSELSYQPNHGQLKILFAGNEPAGGLVARALELPGLPAMSFNAEGRGPLKQWRAHWSLAASGQPFVAGNVAIDASNNAHRLQANFEGFLSPILPPSINAVFDGKTVGSVDGSWTNAGAFDARSVSIKNDVLELSANGGLDTNQNYVHGSGRIRIKRTDGQPVSLFNTDGSAFVFSDFQGAITIPDQSGPRRITSEFSLTKLDTPWGKLGRAEFNASAEQSHPIGRTAHTLSSAVISLAFREIEPNDEKLQSIVGQSIDVQARGHGSPGSAVIESFTANTTAVLLKGTGELKRGVASLSANVVASDLNKFSSLSSQPLFGSATMKVNAAVPIETGAIKVAFDGIAKDSGIGSQGEDSILKGETNFAVVGQWSGWDNWTINNAEVSHPKLSFRAEGKLVSGEISARVESKLNDLTLVSSSLRGAALMSGRVDGTSTSLKSSLSLSSADMTLNGKPISGLAMTVEGSGPTTDHRGRFNIIGASGGIKLDGSGLFSVADSGAFSVDDLNVAMGSTRLAGHVKKAGGKPITGRFQLSAPKLGEFTALTDEPLSGSIAATAELAGTTQRPLLRLTAKSKRAQIAGVQITSLNAAADLANYLTAIEGRTDVRLEAMTSDSVRASELRAQLADGKNGLAFEVTGVLNGAKAAISGDLIQKNSDYAIDLADLQLTTADVSIKLDGPGKIAVSSGAIEIKNFGIAASGGRATVSGKVSRDDVDLKIGLIRIPAAIANVWDEDLGLGGTIDGSIITTGTFNVPDATISLDWRNATTAAATTAGLPPFAVSVSGDLRGDKYENRVTVRGRDSLNILAVGGGTISQSQKISQRVTGEVPLAMGNATLAERGTRLGGNVVVDTTFAGSLEQPQLSGTLTLSGATVNDPASGLKLSSLRGIARLNGDTLVLEQMRATSDEGGVVDEQGNISGLSTRELQTQIAVRIDGVKFNDNDLMAGEVDGDLSLTGPVTNLNASGSIYIKRLDVTVPNQLPRSVTVLDLTHVNAPPHLRSTASKLNREAASRGGSSGVSLKLAINAADRIFVRGRGLDAQLGGGVRISGPTTKPAATGSFDLVKGRLSILGRQLDFKQGKISFNGDLDPYLELEASALADDVTAKVNVYGPLSRLKFRFSSIPDLPEDEVVAKLLFNKSLAKLSPLQIAQLANEIDKIGGLSSGPGILDQLKSSVGVDVLDFGTDDSGGATVSAGSYLNDQTYVGVQQGTEASSSRVVIDHDLTKTLKAKGEVGADGNSKIGIGVEWDY